MRDVARSWVLLALGIGLDVAGATCLSTLAIAFRDVDLSVAYTIWSVTGITLVASIGIYACGEPATFARLFWMAVILGGVVGVRWSSTGDVPR